MGLPYNSRAAGTSLAGQVVGSGIVTDISNILQNTGGNQQEKMGTCTAWGDPR